MKYKAVIADVDGTLVQPNAPANTRASKRIVQSVLQAEKKGLKFTMATARSLEWVTGLGESLSLSTAVILDNGARIYDYNRKEYVYELFLESSQVEEILQVLKPFNKVITIAGKKVRYEYKNNYDGSKVIKVVVLHTDPQLTDEIFLQVSTVKDVTVTKSISGDNPRVESIHVTHPRASKKESLIELAKYMNISLDKFIGIGDSYNDAGFLSICGLKVAMDNAVPQIKAIADYIAPSYNKDGVADVIERFILQQ